RGDIDDLVGCRGGGVSESARRVCVSVPPSAAGIQRAGECRNADAHCAEAREEHRPGMLSVGEQQRVAIAPALVMQPTLLLADEPTGDLDEHTADTLHDLLREMHRERGLTSLIATHNPRLAAACDRVLRLEDGRLRPDR